MKRGERSRVPQVCGNRTQQRMGTGSTANLGYSFQVAGEITVSRFHAGRIGAHLFVEKHLHAAPFPARLARLAEQLSDARGAHKNTGANKCRIHGSTGEDSARPVGPTT